MESTGIKPHSLWLLKGTKIIEDIKEFSSEEDYYSNKKSYPCNMFDEAQNSLPFSETIYASLTVEEIDITQTKV